MLFLKEVKAANHHRFNLVLNKRQSLALICKIMLYNKLLVHVESVSIRAVTHGSHCFQKLTVKQPQVISTQVNCFES